MEGGWLFCTCRPGLAAEQYQFQVAPIDSTQLAIAGGVGTAAGLLLGGQLLARFAVPSLKNIMGLVVACAALMLAATGAYFLHCDEISVVGISTPYPSLPPAPGGSTSAAFDVALHVTAVPSHESFYVDSSSTFLFLAHPFLQPPSFARGLSKQGLDSACNADCGCIGPRETFAPVCGGDGRCVSLLVC